MKDKILVFLVLTMISSSCGNNEEARRDTARTAQKAVPEKRKSMVFFGDSLTAGYGLDEPSQAFPALIQQKLDSAGLGYQVVNAGVSGETSSGGVERIDWILGNPVDVFILELGANDGLRGIPIAETKKNLQMIIDKVKAKSPSARIILTGMEVPPNMGQQYASQFRSIFTELAKKNELPLVPFLLEGVGGEPKLNQADGIHPTPEGHKIVAANVWPEVMKAIGN
jgi:acyl-CoA thioesterase-1